MTTIVEAIGQIRDTQKKQSKPLAIVLAGHNGSGKSTMWRETLAHELQIPLINADRMMLSILPEADASGGLTKWARDLRDTNTGWMRVAQQGVQSFVVHAMTQKVPFAMETVFSYLQTKDGKTYSKVGLIDDMQRAGYFVLLIFVGLSNVNLSIGRVATRVASNGHDVPIERLRDRFPRTQQAIKLALDVADSSLLVDNSRSQEHAFTVCRIQIGKHEVYDVRAIERPPSAIAEWLDKVSPRS